LGTVLTLIKLQLCAGARIERAKNKVGTILKFLGALFFILAALFVFVSIYSLITMQFTAPFINEAGKTQNLAEEFLVFSFLGFQILQTFFLTPILLKNLIINNERETLLKLPVTPMQIFISKFIVSYMFELIFTVCVLLPVLIAFGIMTQAAISFWLFMPFVILLMPALPFFLAALFIFPLLNLIRALKNRPFWTFAVYAVSLSFIAFLYMQIVEGAAYLVINKGILDVLKKNAAGITKTSNYFILQNLFSKVLIDSLEERLIGFALLLIVCAALMAATFLTANLLYKRAYMNENVKERNFSKKGNLKQSGKTLALIKKELKNIFRSSNYSFQFLLIIIITPLFVFFCNKLAAYSSFESFRSGGISEDALINTQNMMFGISLLIITILIPLANSFAASNITREGNCIYNTKIVPVSFRKQLLVKFFVCFVPTAATVFVSSFIVLIPASAANLLGELPTITKLQSFELFGIATLLSIGYISLGTYLDLKKPLCSQIGGGELINATKHINAIIFLGLILAAGFGLLSIFGSVLFKDFNLNLIYWPVSTIFALFTFFWLYFAGPKKYYQLEP